MKTFLKLVALSILIIINSCSAPRFIKKEFIGCYDNSNFKIDMLLNVNGCFSVMYEASSEKEPNNLHCTIVFYTDGIVVRRAGWTSVPVNKMDEKIRDDFDQVYADPLSNKYYREGRGMYEWGLYELKGDIIKAQFIYRPYPPDLYNSYIVMYKIVNKNTIQEISFENVPLPKRRSTTSIPAKPFLDKFYHFIAVENLPSSKCWLQDEKWFWCNEQQFLEYQSKK